ncbi:MAG: flagellar hook-associated protein FlgL [Lachnospiraceae bacterium]|jgi:flagellar hook-associated protein 3 FlgL|nr:flagellar hook-associated protein FlgL [Lachnospiraceae bacterium]
MRITNQIMQKNNLSNIKISKTAQDTLSKQMSGQKKISRPSEDPVVAIRALRLRSNVSEITQYYSKNIPDAQNWLSLTEDSLSELADILDDMGKQFEKGANGELKSSDRQVIATQLKELQDAYYACGNSDLAGRYLFTGLRTSSSLRFLEDQTKAYTITQQMDQTAIDTVTAVKTTAAGNTMDLMDVNASNYDTISVTQKDVEAKELHRIRLSYNECDAGYAPTLQYTDETGNVVTLNAITIPSHEEPYTKVDATNPLVFVPETGELLMDDATYDKLAATKDNVTTQAQNESEIRITYQKSKWIQGDLRPEHYYACEAKDDSGNTISYNAEYLNTYGLPDSQSSQSISYDVGFSQSLQINTTADQCFDPGIQRDIDDMLGALDDWTKMESIQTQLKELLAKAQGADATAIQEKLQAVDKAITFQKDKVQKMFESGLTAMDGYLNQVSLSITECGTRASKLDLIEKRSLGQKTSFEELADDNENIDITEVAIQLSSAEFTYNAALLATGKVMQASLINYI